MHETGLVEDVTDVFDRFRLEDQDRAVLRVKVIGANLHGILQKLTLFRQTCI
jgi:hypothetical protein